MNLRWLTSFINFDINGVFSKPRGMNLAIICQLSTFIRWFSWHMLSERKSLSENFIRVRRFDLVWRLFLLIRMLRFCFLHLNLTITVSFLFQTVACFKIIRFHLVAGSGQCPTNAVFRNIITNRRRTTIYLQWFTAMILSIANGRPLQLNNSFSQWTVAVFTDS